MLPGRRPSTLGILDLRYRGLIAIMRSVRPHVHLGVVIAAALLLIGLLGAVLGPTFMRDEWSSNHSADEDRSDRRPWNNDASLQSFPN